jgi:hypothetical protein
VNKMVKQNLKPLAAEYLTAIYEDVMIGKLSSNAADVEIR